MTYQILVVFSSLVLGSCSGSLARLEQVERRLNQDGDRLFAMAGEVLIPHPEARCLVQREEEGWPPFWLNEEKIMLTRFVNTCENTSGESGYLFGSHVTTMGFPCSGGGGKILIEGHVHSPNIISFLVKNDCPMKKFNEKPLGLYKINHLVISKDSMVEAHYPFSVQFWELVGYPESDVSDKVTLRLKQTKEELWNQFNQNQPIEVLLYGRENSWAVDHPLYQVKALFVPEAHRSFSLEVIYAKPLSVEEEDVVRQKCLSLQPKRPCHQIFERS